QPWARGHPSRPVAHWLKLLRAQEEIQRLNIEIKRVSTWMVHDEAQLQAVIDSLQTTDLLMAKALMEFTSDQKRVNAHVRATLKHIYELEGYTGEMGIGQREGTDGLPKSDMHVSDLEEYSDEDEELLNDVFEGVSNLTINE
ncbi:hypothetical protein JB92DRAFT_2697435, partial [Gautieria morchelliformis]